MGPLIRRINHRTRWTHAVSYIKIITSVKGRSIVIKNLEPPLRLILTLSLQKNQRNIPIAFLMRIYLSHFVRAIFNIVIQFKLSGINHRFAKFRDEKQSGDLYVFSRKEKSEKEGECKVILLTWLLSRWKKRRRFLNSRENLIPLTFGKSLLRERSSRRIAQSSFISSKWTMLLSILVGFRAPRALLSSQD